MNEDNPTNVLGQILNTEEDRIIKKQAISTLEAIEQSKLKAGCIGKFLGTEMPNMAVYSAVILCIILLFATIIEMIASVWICKSFILELMKIIIPVFTMSLGYMFGKNDAK